jgi:hydroxypyruvate isomerase
VELCQRLGSDNFGLLYDIYHMQIMEATSSPPSASITPAPWHYHTAGVPGRNEIGDQQELRYPAICHAIRDTGFKGIWRRNSRLQRPIRCLMREAIRLCDV